jgi:hypothetical protein
MNNIKTDKWQNELNGAVPFDFVTADLSAADVITMQLVGGGEHFAGIDHCNMQQRAENMENTWMHS